MKKTPKFPNDFKEIEHPVITGGTQWVYPIEGETIISIVGGGRGLYGDGITTFEMYDFREDDVEGYLTVEDINQHLADNPIPEGYVLDEDWYRT